MANAFYTPSGSPGTGSSGLSAVIRAEFASISTAFDMLPRISTTGVFDTVFNQQGNYAFTLPAAPGTLATLSDVAGEATRATTAEGVNATAITTEATRATTAEGVNATAITTEATRATTAEGVVATAITTEATRATTAEGVNATAITTEATRATTAEALKAPLGAINNFGRNRIHNGAMEILQRGTAFSAIGSPYTADRWQVSSASAATASFGSIGGMTSRKGLSLSGAMTAGQAWNVLQKIESGNCSDLVGQTVTLSCCGYTSHSAGTLTVNAQLFYAGSTDNFAGGSLVSIGSVVVPMTGVAATYGVPFGPLPAGAANGLYVQYNIVQTGATSTNSFQLTSVQLEPGPATPFEHRDPALDLMLCQRFYQGVGLSGFGYGNAGSYTGQSTQLTVPMRVIPTATPAGVTFGNGSGLVLSPSATSLFWYYAITAAGLAQLGGTALLSADL